MMEETNIAELIVEYIRNHFDIEPNAEKTNAGRNS